VEGEEKFVEGKQNRILFLRVWLKEQDGFEVDNYRGNGS
jgi:hypothetical protein